MLGTLSISLRCTCDVPARYTTPCPQWLGSPRDVAIGVAARSFWFAPVDFDFPAMNTGGGGSPSQPRSRNATTSCGTTSAQRLHFAAWSPLTFTNSLFTRRALVLLVPSALYSGSGGSYLWPLRSSKQRSTTDGSAYASNVGPASLNRMMSASAW